MLLDRSVNPDIVNRYKQVNVDFIIDAFVNQD